MSNSPLANRHSSPIVQTLTLLLILVLGGLARFWNLDWDRGAYTLHPDEWALNEVVRGLGPDLNPHFFFYGSLPIYLYRGLAEVLGALTGMDWLEPERLALVGRAVSALASTATLLLLFAVGRRLWGEWAGLLAAAFGAGAVLLIQAAHFGTVESLLALEAVGLLLVSLHIAGGGGRRAYAVAGVLWGLALATKLTAVSFVVMPLVGYIAWWGTWRINPHATSERSPPARAEPSVRLRINRPGLGPGLFIVCVALTILLTSPYYVLAWDELWAAIREQSDELAGAGRFPYVWQFEGSIPYLFELQNLAVWGLGLPLGVAALVGWGLLITGSWSRPNSAGLRIADWVKRRRTKDERRNIHNQQHIPHSALVWVWPTLYLLYIGTWGARFVRHLVPLIPFCCLFAVYLLLRVRGSGAGSRRGSEWRLWAARLLGAGALLGTAVWALSFLSIYATADTRWQATEWIRANVAPGTVMVVEDKNDLLPHSDATYPPELYRYEVMKITEPDTPSKMVDFSAALAQGDYLVVPNNRWSGVLPRLGRFPLTGRYYTLLFSGELGYQEVATFESRPRLGPLVWDDSASEETFQVFDHPTVRVFRNVERLGKGELKRLLGVDR